MLLSYGVMFLLVVIQNTTLFSFATVVFKTVKYESVNKLYLSAELKLFTLFLAY